MCVCVCMCVFTLWLLNYHFLAWSTVLETRRDPCRTYNSFSSRNPPLLLESGSVGVVRSFDVDYGDCRKKRMRWSLLLRLRFFSWNDYNTQKTQTHITTTTKNERFYLNFIFLSKQHWRNFFNSHVLSFVVVRFQDRNRIYYYLFFFFLFLFLNVFYWRFIKLIFLIEIFLFRFVCCCSFSGSQPHLLLFVIFYCDC